MRCRRVIVAIGCLVALALVARGACYIGWVSPVHIAGGSMAPGLVGPHHLVSCADCAFVFRCGAGSPPPLNLAVCPNCGFRGNGLNGSPRMGDAVLVDTFPFWWRAPRRWEVVAYGPTSPFAISEVKRIVGLPGEEIAIDHGEVFANGRLLVKSWRQFRELGVLVHDNDFRSNDPKLPPRWRPASSPSHWSAQNSAFTFAPERSVAENDFDKADWDWLEYHHLRCDLNPFPRDEPSPVFDNDSYNQGTSRQLSIVDDLMLVANLNLAGEANIGIQIESGGHIWTVAAASTTGIAQLLRDGEVVLERNVPRKLFRGSHEWALAVFDRQVVWAFEGQPKMSFSFEPTARSESPRPIRIGARGAEVQVAHLRVYRDIYYLNRQPVEFDSTVSHLAEDEYFVLGDNVPISRDSRHWEKAGLSRDRILGTVTLRNRAN